MQVHEIMADDPVCCSPATSLQNAAKLMANCHGGGIPVIDYQDRPVGIITARDIWCRGVANGMDPARTSVCRVMSWPALTVGHTDTIDDCCGLMDKHQIRCIPVVDNFGVCRGLITQADITRDAKLETARAVRDISPSAVATRASIIGQDQARNSRRYPWSDE